MAMTLFELQYRLLRPFLLPLHYQVHKELKIAVDSIVDDKVMLLDVGGRKSHYTIGLECLVTISDLPRETPLQSKLHLGINDQITDQIKTRRSNVMDVVYDDMRYSTLPSGSFDIVVAVEVLEHVDRDDLFIQNVYRVLKPGGVFIITTPNGDYITEVNNPDHKRHYRRRQLSELLESSSFTDVEIRHAVTSGPLHRWGLKSWSLRRPLQTARSAGSNLLENWMPAQGSVAERTMGTHHLVAKARKAAS